MGPPQEDDPNTGFWTELRSNTVQRQRCGPFLRQLPPPIRLEEVVRESQLFRIRDCTLKAIDAEEMNNLPSTKGKQRMNGPAFFHRILEIMCKGRRRCHWSFFQTTYSQPGSNMRCFFSSQETSLFISHPSRNQVRVGENQTVRMTTRGRIPKSQKTPKLSASIVTVCAETPLTGPGCPARPIQRIQSTRPQTRLRDSELDKKSAHQGLTSLTYLCLQPPKCPVW